MASFNKRKLKTGEVSYVAWVRIRPYKPITKSFPSLAEAKNWAKTKESELRDLRKRQAVSGDFTALTVSQLVRAYLESPEAKALTDYDGRELQLAWWVNEHGKAKVMQLSVVALRGARDQLIREGKAPATVNRYMAAMRSAWNWGRAAAHIPTDHAWPPRLMLREDNKRERFLTEDEMQRLLQAARNQGLEIFAAVTTALATGMRQANLLGLRWGDVDLERQQVLLHQTKQKRKQGIHLLASAAKALAAIQPADPAPDDLVFGMTVGQLRSAWDRLRDEVGIRDVRWHDLRHTCASLLAQAGASLLEIGTVLGHSSPATSARYAHLVRAAKVTGMDSLNERLKG
jgi:integrase